MLGILVDYSIQVSSCNLCFQIRNCALKLLVSVICALTRKTAAHYNDNKMIIKIVKAMYKHVVLLIVKVNITRKCVYETLYPQPYACP